MGLRVVRQTAGGSVAAAVRRAGGWIQELLSGERDERDVFGEGRNGGGRATYLTLAADGRLDALR